MIDNGGSTLGPYQYNSSIYHWCYIPSYISLVFHHVVMYSLSELTLCCFYMELTLIALLLVSVFLLPP